MATQRLSALLTLIMVPGASPAITVGLRQVPLIRGVSVLGNERLLSGVPSPRRRQYTRTKTPVNSTALQLQGWTMVIITTEHGKQVVAITTASAAQHAATLIIHLKMKRGALCVVEWAAADATSSKPYVPASHECQQLIFPAAPPPFPLLSLLCAL